MDRLKYTLLVISLLFPLYGDAWQSSTEDRRTTRDHRRPGVHYHSKRHMLPNEQEDKKRIQPQKSREPRRKLNIKPTGHLTPLKEDDMENDEVVSVAIGPPPMRPMYDKMNWKHASKMNNVSQGKEGHNCTHGATNMVKDVLTQLGREFMSNQVSEDFVFGQYVGIAMKNMTSDLKLRLQHEILELVIRYQKLSRGDVMTPKPEEKSPLILFNNNNNNSKKTNETDDMWPDFSNLAKIVG